MDIFSTIRINEASSVGGLTRAGGREPVVVDADGAVRRLGATPGMKQILFVDDEVNVLQGLGRMLRVMRHEWEMTFLDDPRQALDLIESKSFDALVIDIRMPRMDGAEFCPGRAKRNPGWRVSCFPGTRSVKPRCAR